MRNCLIGTHSGCASWDAQSACEATRRHLESSCAWPTVFEHVHAVHFKGKSKPWPSMQRRTMACRHLRLGMPIVPGANPTANDRHLAEEHATTSVKLEAADLLEWNTTAGMCMSLRWQRPVYWAATQCMAADTGKCGGMERMSLPKCCSFGTTLAAKWHQYLLRP